ncbi:hypothetical protein BGZ97_001254 [Linnemannia gamsii]|uniref:Uncharacterized protein n=1 Tax=Linnemannia gamsii TaxID=64522 RepID=A0A9P6R0T0_9FUNG|nr:hypothetical protein BGZ97_001254 [Linnemannia gamsii]
MGIHKECPECKKSPEVVSGTEEAEPLRVSSFRPAKFVERMVQAQSVHCPTAMTMWCHWSGPLKDTEEHLESCNFAFEHTCAYRYLGCTFKGGATDVANHVKHCTLQPSQPSYSTNASSSHRVHTPSGSGHHHPHHHYHQQQQQQQQQQHSPQSGFGIRQQFETSRGQGPMSPPQSSPPLPTVPPPVPHPHHRPMAHRTGAHPGYLVGHHHQHQQSHHQQTPLYFHTPIVPPSAPSAPIQSLPPIATAVGEPFERAGSYDVSQDFEQLSIDELQRALDTELEDDNYDNDLALYGPSTTATTGAENGEGDEEFVQVERTNSMADMDISDLEMSRSVTKDSLPQETREVITQSPSQEPTLDVAQEVIESTTEAAPQQAISTQESPSLVSPIITQQGEEDELMIQCGQGLGQEVQELPLEETQLEAVREKQSQSQETPQAQDEKEIPASILSTLSPHMQQNLSLSASRDHPPPENDLPPAQRRRIILDETESNQRSGNLVGDGDYAGDLHALTDKQRESSATSSAHIDQLPRRSISYRREDPLDKSRRILRDITHNLASPCEGPRSSVLPHYATRSSTSSSSTRPRSVLGSGMGLAAEVFRVLNQTQFHHPHHQQQDQQTSRRRSSEPGQHSPSRKSPVGPRRSSGRFNPLPLRMVSSVPSSTTAASSPLMQASAITSPAHGTPLVSPPVSSSDDEADPADADQAQQCQQRSANAELANFLALTQNPPAHLIAEPEPHAFVPFIAYKPRYLKSRRKKGKAGRMYGLPIVRDKDAHNRYQNLVPTTLTPDIASPEDSIASQADRHHDN